MFDQKLNIIELLVYYLCQLIYLRILGKKQKIFDQLGEQANIDRKTTQINCVLNNTAFITSISSEEAHIQSTNFRAELSALLILVCVLWFAGFQESIVANTKCCAGKKMLSRLKSMS